MCEPITLYPYTGMLPSQGAAFGGDGNGLELDLGGGGGYVGVYICQNSCNFTLTTGAFYIQIIPP